MKPTYISSDQWKSIFKGIVYSFLSAFTGTLTLMAIDFIRAAQQGKAAILDLTIALAAAAFISGINGVLVFAKKLFTPPTE